ncbi:MAG: phosphoglycerate dehydrogenase [Aeromicrobium sp.]
MSKRVLVTCAQMQVELPAHRARIEAAGYEVVAPPIPGQHFKATELAEYMPGTVGIIAGDDELNRQFFEASPDLQVLIRWGIGMDSVDHAAAAEHGVIVANTPGVFGEEVADSAMAYILLLARGHNEVDQAVRSGAWPKREGISLSASTLGVVGLGGIGRSVAMRGLGFGMTVGGYDPYVASDMVPDQVRLEADLATLLAESRFVVLTCPLTPETRHLIDASAVALMRRDAYLINVARGAVVDEDALVDALATGSIAGAGLDVFEVEPLPAESPLRGMSNVILGAHNGSNTREGVVRASARAVDRLLEALGA